MQEKALFSLVVQDFKKKYKRVIWDSDRIYETYAKRSLVDIEKSREIH